MFIGQSLINNQINKVHLVVQFSKNSNLTLVQYDSALESEHGRSILQENLALTKENLYWGPWTWDKFRFLKDHVFQWTHKVWTVNLSYAIKLFNPLESSNSISLVDLKLDFNTFPFKYVLICYRILHGYTECMSRKTRQGISKAY